MKLSEEIETIVWAFDQRDSRREEIRRLALHVQMMEQELDGLRAREQQAWQIHSVPGVTAQEVLDKLRVQPGELKPVPPPQAPAQDIADLLRRVARLERDNTFLWHGLQIDYDRKALGRGLATATETREQAVERDGDRGARR